MPRLLRPIGGIALVSLLVAFAGCSRIPTGPEAPAGSSAAARSAGSSRLTMSTEPDGPAPAPDPTPVAVSTSRTINGLLGGIVSAGRFTVVIPPLAIRGVATVTVSMPDTSELRCDLGIQPASANGFGVPVLLVAQCGGLLDLGRLRDSRILWLNPATGQWVPVPGSQVDLAGLSVSAPLQHFSSYRVGGKAGW